MMSLNNDAMSVRARRSAQLGLVLLLCLGAVAPECLAQTWSHKNLHARYGHTAVFDAATNKMIIFAGQHQISLPNEFDVWWSEYNPGSTELHMFNVLPLGTAPTPRYGHSAVYDGVNSVMTVFGGGKGTGGTPAPCLNDLWLLRNANGVAGSAVWSKLTASGTAPTARFAHSAAYDPGSNTMIMFGGYDCSSTYFNDVWTLSNANGSGGTSTWTKLAPTGTAPSVREAASAVYDSTNNLLIIYGGDAGTSVYGDLWVLSHANGQGGTPAWSQLAPTGTLPASRSGHSAIYDSANNRMTIYGGQTASGSSALLNDFWLLTTANGQGGTPAWSQLFPVTPGAFRSFHTAVYDAAQNTMLIFGGKTLSQLLPTDDHVTVVTSANGMQ
jgi:hypothetical protein